MKKYLSAILALFLLCTLTACEEQGTDEGTSPHRTESEFVPKTETVLESESESIPPAGQPEHEELSYGSPTVRSGDYSIHPIVCLDYTDQYENGENTLCGCGMGFEAVSANPDVDHTDLPYIILDQSVELTGNTAILTLSEGCRIYDTAFNTSKYINKAFGELQTLPKGEYVVTFSGRADSRGGDESIKDYWLTAYTYVFKLIVPETAENRELLPGNDSGYRIGIYLNRFEELKVENCYLFYMPYVNDQSISVASRSLREKLENNERYAAYLEVDGEGYLCIGIEIIRDIPDHPAGEGGCGIDHEHIFLRERISTLPHDGE